MDSKGVQVIVWDNFAQFLDEVMQTMGNVIFVLDNNADSRFQKNTIREDVLSFFDKDEKLFLVYGEGKGCYLARKEILLIALTRIASSIGPTVSSFSDCLSVLQTDPFSRGLMRAYNAAGPYPLW
jgi:hypothetical protein